ncbi:MAG: hypothetical protein FJ247_12280 [Nitrospira sp.]|nr:hypothetical protein [Nitrospira sp.]
MSPKAAQRKTLWLVLIASALASCPLANASSDSVQTLKTRAELSRTTTTNRVEFGVATPEAASSYYDAPSTTASDSPVAPREAVLGQKLDYLFGKATGRAHSIERSTDMLRHMERIGLPDTPANRQLMSQHFQGVLNDATNIVATGRNGTTIRESLLMGPNGGVKVTSYWDGETLRTFILEGVGSRFSP